MTRKIKFTIPRTIGQAKKELDGIEALLNQHRWARAATVAAHTGKMTCQEFADLGIHGLTSAVTVRVYADRWMDHHYGRRPNPGQEIVLPDEEWEPIRPDSLGSRVSADPEVAVAQVIEKHGVGVIAKAVRRPAVAKAVVADTSAHRAVSTEIIEQQRQLHDAVERERGGIRGGLAGLMEKLLVQIGARLYVNDGKRFYENVMKHERDATPWKPGEIEAVRKAAQEGAEYGTNVVAMLTEVKEEDLQDLLNER